MKYLRILIFLFLTGTSQAKPISKSVDWPKIYTEKVFNITEVMVTDVSSPPVAARIYAYSTLSTYVIMQASGAVFRHNDLLSGSNILSQIWEAPVNISSPEFASIYAMLLVGEAIMPSGYLLKSKQHDWIEHALKNRIVTKKNLDQHISYASIIASQVIELAKNDGYLQLSALNRYTPLKGEGYWYPTPPAYISAVEPDWQTIRPFYLDELEKYEPNPMAPFDMNEGSGFHTQLMEVYHTVNNLTENQKLIANFWDCNPFKVEYSGHMAIGVKKISPGGHWMGITGIAAQKSNLSFAETAYVHVLVGLTLHDAFISCWSAKYKTNRIRPETVINQKFDQKWKPLLQTPPFPEYTSGHSVISRASAVVLTGYFGDHYSFIDTSEKYFGLPDRPFDSFLLASQEAAISRLYGGIHFRDAIEEGVKQGDKIGEMIWEKVK